MQNKCQKDPHRLLVVLIKKTSGQKFNRNRKSTFSLGRGVGAQSLLLVDSSSQKDHRKMLFLE